LAITASTGLGCRSFDLDAGLGHGAQRDAHIGFAVAHPPGNIGERADLQVKSDALVLAAEVRDQRRNEVEGKALGARHAHMPAAQAAQAGNVVRDALDVLLRPLGMRRQQFARGIGLHAARMALEEQGVQLALQPRHLPAHRRGRHVELERGLLHRAGFHDLEKVAHGGLLQGTKLHESLLWREAMRTTSIADSATKNSKHCACDTGMTLLG
jgi:hypothetical protein